MREMYIRELETPLLLPWAEQMQALKLCDEACHVDGPPRFLAAATGLTSLDLWCDREKTAGLADYLMSKCSSVTKLRLYGRVQPCIYPLSVSRLTVRFQPLHDEPFQDEAQPANVICRAERLPLLRDLSLEQYGARQVILQCPVNLHRLDRLFVKFVLCAGTTFLNLSWLWRQPCHHLELEVVSLSQDCALMASLVQQAGPLKLSSLALELHTTFDARLQELWHRFTPGRFRWIVHHPTAFDNPADALQTLPACSPETTIEFPAGHTGPRFVEWDALASHAGRIRLVMQPRMRLLISQPHSCKSFPDHLSQPWQLVVVGDCDVVGLLDSQPTEFAYFLQNAAARATGWTDSI